MKRNENVCLYMYVYIYMLKQDEFLKVLKIKCKFKRMVCFFKVQYVICKKKKNMYVSLNYFGVFFNYLYL